MIEGSKSGAAFAMDGDSGSWIVDMVGSLARVIWGRSAANTTYYIPINQLQVELTDTKARLDAEVAGKEEAAEAAIAEKH